MSYLAPTQLPPAPPPATALSSSSPSRPLSPNSVLRYLSSSNANSTPVGFADWSTTTSDSVGGVDDYEDDEIETELDTEDDDDDDDDDQATAETAAATATSDVDRSAVMTTTSTTTELDTVVISNRRSLVYADHDPGVLLTSSSDSGNRNWKGLYSSNHGSEQGGEEQQNPVSQARTKSLLQSSHRTKAQDRHNDVFKNSPTKKSPPPPDVDITKPSSVHPPIAPSGSSGGSTSDFRKLMFQVKSPRSVWQRWTTAIIFPLRLQQQQQQRNSSTKDVLNLVSSTNTPHTAASSPRRMRLRLLFGGAGRRSRRQQQQQLQLQQKASVDSLFRKPPVDLVCIPESNLSISSSTSSVWSVTEQHAPRPRSAATSTTTTSTPPILLPIQPPPPHLLFHHFQQEQLDAQEQQAVDDDHHGHDHSHGHQHHQSQWVDLLDPHSRRLVDELVIFEDDNDDDDDDDSSDNGSSEPNPSEAEKDDDDNDDDDDDEEWRKVVNRYHQVVVEWSSSSSSTNVAAASVVDSKAPDNEEAGDEEENNSQQQGQGHHKRRHRRQVWHGRLGPSIAGRMHSNPYLREYLQEFPEPPLLDITLHPPVSDDPYAPDPLFAARVAAEQVPTVASATTGGNSSSGISSDRIQQLYHESRFGAAQQHQQQQQQLDPKMIVVTTPPSTPQRVELRRSSLPKTKAKSSIAKSDGNMKTPRFVDMVYKPFAITQQDEDVLSTPHTATTASSTEVLTPESSPSKSKMTVSFQSSSDEDDDNRNHAQHHRAKEFPPTLPLDIGESKVDVSQHKQQQQQQQEVIEEYEGKSSFSRALAVYVYEWRQKTEETWKNRGFIREQGIPNEAALMANESRIGPETDAIVDKPDSLLPNMAALSHNAEPTMRQNAVITEEKGVADKNSEDEEMENPIEETFSSSLASYMHQWRQTTKSTWDKKELIRQQGLPHLVVVIATEEMDFPIRR